MITEMTPKELKRELLKAMVAKLPIMIKGAPGVGKSDIVEQVAEELGMNLIISHPVVSDPTDAKGLPAIVNGKAEFLPFGDLRRMMEAKKPTIAFLDDLGQAPAVVQAAFMQLILARRINGHKISKHIVFIAATNRRKDKAGVTSILEPIKSRFASIWELKASPEDWIEWAYANDMPTDLIGWIHFRPDMLCKDEATTDIVNHPCPRTVASAGRLTKAGMDSLKILQGTLGEAGGIDYYGFRKVFNSLPNIDALIANPASAIVPNEPSTLYAVVAALVEKGTKKNANNIFAYAERLPAEFGALLWRDLAQKKPETKETTGYIQWAVAHQDLIM